jgi:hypothetical protein
MIDILHLRAAAPSAGDGDDIEDDETRLARYIDACGSVDSHDSGRWSATDNEDARMNEILSNQEARKSIVQSGAAAEQGTDSPQGNQSAVAKKRMNDFFLDAATIIQKMGQVRDPAQSAVSFATFRIRSTGS